MWGRILRPFSFAVLRADHADKAPATARCSIIEGADDKQTLSINGTYVAPFERAGFRRKD